MFAFSMLDDDEV